MELMMDFRFKSKLDMEKTDEIEEDYCHIN